jgi:transcriptional regulator with XRE-family HTH domain
MKKSFNEKLKSLRAGTSQAEKAALFGVSQSAYSAWERGEAEPNITTLSSMCRHYKVSSDWLLGLLDEGQHAQTPVAESAKASRMVTETSMDAKIAKAVLGPCPTCAAKDTVIADLSACLREVSKSQGFPAKAHSSTKAPAPF